jgi:hypothetical protein
MKRFKVFLFALCIIISIIGISNLTTENSLFPSLKQLALINSAQAEELDPIVVSPNKGNADSRPCTYYTYDFTCGWSVGFPNILSWECSTTAVEHAGQVVICPSDTEDYCDYITCH